jgi:hypothetical protein
LSRLAVALDHTGILSKQQRLFDRDQNLTNRKRHRPLLSYMTKEIRDCYDPVATFFKFDLSDIVVIAEDSNRASAMDVFDPTDVRIFELRNDNLSFDPACNSSLRVSCQGITAAIVARLAITTEDIIHTFWQFDLWRTDPGVITNGTLMALESYGIANKIVQRIVMPNNGTDDWRIETREFNHNSETIGVKLAVPMLLQK